MKKKTKSLCCSLIVLIAVTLFYLIMTHHYDTTSRVNGPSMLPTLQDKSTLYAVNKDLEYGDIVGINYDDAYINYHKAKNDPDRSGDHIVKRLIGLPGDTIKVTPEGVYRNGELLVEEYLPEENRLASYVREDDPYLECTLGENECYVMGDNRIGSIDSRIVGPVQMKNIHPESTTFTWYSQRYNILLRIGQVVGLFFLGKWLYLDRKEDQEEESRAVVVENRK